MPYWCTPKLFGGPVDDRFEQAGWESFEAHPLLGIVWWNFHEVVASVWINLDGVIPASGLIQYLHNRAHIRFNTLRRIELAERHQQRAL